MDATSPLIEAAELADRRSDPNLRIVDATWFLQNPDGGRRAYEVEHIEGAVFFDLDAVSTPHSTLPHMMPSGSMFADAVGALGIADHHEIVVYDQQGMFSAPRVWFTFQIMGAANVRVLNGGLPAWRAAGFPGTAVIPSHAPATFHASFADDRIVDMAALKTAISRPLSAVLDARPAGRFAGHEPEPRAGLPSGHMPGARSVPAASLLDADGRLRPADQLSERLGPLVRQGHTPIATCGSGVTACVILLALEVIGIQNGRLYDGSWAEWASHPDAAILTGDDSE